METEGLEGRLVLGFIPINGVMVIDTCGITDSRKREDTIDVKYEKIEDLKRRYLGLKERGQVLTTPSCLEELNRGIVGLRRIKKRGEKDLRSKIRQFGRSLRLPQSYQNAERFQLLDESLQTRKRIYDWLINATKEYENARTQIDPSWAFLFAKKNSELSPSNVEVVSRALSLGDGVGILSSDRLLLYAYHSGVRYFGLNDCFSCNSLTRETKRIT